MKLEEAKRKLDYYKKILLVTDETGTPNDFAEAIETVLQALDNMLEENKELKELANKKQWISPCYVAENYISKNKIREKIAELDKLIKECEEDEEHIGEIPIYIYDKKILEELLEDK